MIDTKALRSRILDFAIQGKLTEQLPSDGTAEDLFPKKLKAIEDIPFDIPDNWKWCKGIDCFKPMESRKPTGDNFNYIDIDAIDNKHQKINQIRTVATKDAPSRASRAVFDGSTLFSLVRPYLRNIAFVDNEASNSIASTGFFVATSNGSLYPLFLYYMMISDYVVMGLNEFMKGDNSPSIRKGHIEQWLFPIPPLAEQKRIVERVEEIFRLLDTIDEAQEKYSAASQILKAKLITAGIQGKLTKQLPSDGTAEELYQQIQAEKQKLIKEGKLKKEKPLPPVSPDEVPFEIPENWMWVRFGDIMWNRDSERIPVSVADRKKLKKIYDYYGASGVIDKVEEYLFDKRLLLIGEDGANLLSRSTPIAFMADGKYWVNNHAHVLDCYVENYLDFVMYYINAISLVPYVTGSAQPKLNQDRMNKIPVPLPPLAEQKRIADVLERALGEID